MVQQFKCSCLNEDAHDRPVAMSIQKTAAEAVRADGNSKRMEISLLVKVKMGVCENTETS